jgi:CrcB protein
MMLREWIWVALGGATGSVLRFAVSQWLKPSGFPWSTFLINIIGSFLLGTCIAVIDKYPSTFPWKSLVAIGFCGGFTTFSALSVECLQLLRLGQTTLFLTYIISTFILGIGAAWLGYQLIK